MTNRPTGGDQTMRAAVTDSFGSPDTISIRRIRRPEPGPDEVLVEIVAAGVNPVDASNRADGTWAGLTPPVVLGSDAAGVVVACGEAVAHVNPGDEVYYFTDFLGNRHGSYADYQTVPGSLVSRKPANLTFAEAAAMPLAAGTAYEAIVRRLAVSDRDTVVIYGAAGGVGLYAVQLAASLGARVIAVARGAHADFLRTVGAEETLDYGEGAVEGRISRSHGSVTALADFVGGDTVSRALSVVAEGGRVATACSLEGDLEPAIDKNITLYGILVRPDRPRLDALSELVEAGRLRPHLRRVLPLEQAALAHVEVERGHGRGKVVLRMRPEPRAT